MRSFLDPPEGVVDPSTGRPRWGSFAGRFRRVELGALPPSGLARLAVEKRWVYGLLAADPWLVGFAVVDLGYAASGFAYAYEHGRGMVASSSWLGVPRWCRVRQGDTARLDARFVHPKGSIRVVERVGDPTVEVRIESPRLDVHATLDAKGAPAAVTAVAPLGDAGVGVTEKRACLAVRGAALVDGHRVSLDGALGGLDFTHGLLPHRTQWNWAFGLGRTRTGERVGFNLVEGFVGEGECALWVDDRTVPISEGRFTFDRAARLGPWRVRSADGEVDLEFEPGAEHTETRNLGLVRSRFAQPLGTFRGTLRVGDRTLELDRCLGVVEDQDVVW